MSEVLPSGPDSVGHGGKAAKCLFYCWNTRAGTPGQNTAGAQQAQSWAAAKAGETALGPAGPRIDPRSLASAPAAAAGKPKDAPAGMPRLTWAHPDFTCRPSTCCKAVGANTEPTNGQPDLGVGCSCEYTLQALRKKKTAGDLGTVLPP